MLDSLLLAEIMADQKRRYLDERISTARLAALVAAGGASRPSGLRARAAAAIVRFGILLDGTAARRAAAQPY